MMKKSERYYKAMMAVINSTINAADKLEILETLMEDRRVAEFTEKRDAEEEKAE